MTPTSSNGSDSQKTQLWDKKLVSVCGVVALVLTVLTLLFFSYSHVTSAKPLNKGEAAFVYGVWWVVTLLLGMAARFYRRKAQV